jgi:uncharacterized protein YlxW (UPF0749 family)
LNQEDTLGWKKNWKRNLERSIQEKQPRMVGVLSLEQRQTQEMETLRSENMILKKQFKIAQAKANQLANYARELKDKLDQLEEQGIDIG